MKYVFIFLFLGLGLKSVNAVELTGKVRALDGGARCGVLSLIESEDSHEFEALNIESIAVFTFFPAELSPVNGVVTLMRQPRSSHISIKAKDWQIPNADLARMSCVKENSENMLQAFKACFQEIQNGDYVYFNVDKDTKTLVLEKVDRGDVKCPSTDSKIGKVEVTSDLNFSSIADHSALNWEDFNKVGSKAANYAQLMKFMNTPQNEVVRPGFAIPFYYYNQFVEENLNLKTEISKVLSDEKLNNPLESIYRGQKLEALRELIMSDAVKINAQFLTAVLEKAETFKGKNGLSRRLKFRSSTNAEDLPNFSGAGLYTSKSYKPLRNGREKSRTKKIKSLSKAIKVVWASIWNKRAFDERALYSIPHDQVYMGIQVNLAFPDEIASGVIVTKNIEEQNGPAAIYIEAQRGDEFSVENPAPGVLAERILVEKSNSSVRKLGGSTVDVDGLTILKTESDVPVLLKRDISQITDYSLKAEAAFSKVFAKNGEAFALDIEFKVDRTLEGDRTVYFKQARPYLIHDQEQSLKAR